MSRIRILPEILANKIAAGEVVERPASVVKELVENALDAGSDRILIDIEKGGRSLIQVADNGTGMDHDDALMALERFATSKIRNDADLFAIQTLGFRGEALPSIAAVSKMTLTTRSAGTDTGVRIRIEGGKIVQVTEAGAPPGTLITVSQLFFNTPARRKFLKAVNTEMGHIADIVAGMALGHPGVHFRLTHDGRRVRQWLRASSPAERAREVLGQTGGETLVTLDSRNGDLRLAGFLAPARQARSTARGIYLYVNGRRVRDRVVQHALFQGYSGRLTKGQYPLAVLFVELPFDQVDVNVHPTKHEIRFVDQRRVHNAIADAVADVLSRNERGRWVVEPQTADGNGHQAVAQPPPAYEGARKSRRSEASEFPPISIAEKEVRPPVMDFETGSPPKANYDAAADATPSAPTGPPRQPALWQNRFFSDLTVIGQFRGTYVICQAGDDLILIDQHAAHERIVYEKLRNRAGRIEVQQLLLPETLELGFAEAGVIQEMVPRLKELGLAIEPFGGTTFVVSAYPVLLDSGRIARLIVELAEKAVETGQPSDPEAAMDQCRMVMACHHAVRANQKLQDVQIRQMLEDLDQCEQPAHCPHGRPTYVKWTLGELEKTFKRIS